MKGLVIVISMFVFVHMVARTAMATPSTQIWIPSTDIQPYMVGHIDADYYFRAAPNSNRGRDYNTLDVGFTLGVLPFDKLQMEIGFDYLTIALNPNDEHPWHGNAKIGTPENSMFGFSPAIAVGIYNAWPGAKVEDAPFMKTGQNIAYGLVAKTIPFVEPVSSLGRFSAGYYHGSKRALKPDNTGLLLSWDRTMKEVSDKLWLAVDYMGGENIDGALSVGFAWRFTDSISLLFGYDMYQRSSLSGEDTLTLQLDVNIP